MLLSLRRPDSEVCGASQPLQLKVNDVTKCWPKGRNEQCGEAFPRWLAFSSFPLPLLCRPGCGGDDNSSEWKRSDRGLTSGACGLALDWFLLEFLYWRETTILSKL